MSRSDEFSWRWALTSLVIFLGVEIALGGVVGRLVTGKFVGHVAALKIEVLLILAGYFGGGLVVGAISPSVRIYEPAVGAALAVQAASTRLPEVKAQSLLATEDAVREGTRDGPRGNGEDRPTHRSGAEDRESVAITVYNQNFGLVREVRDIPLTRGLLDLEFGDVASSIQTETVHIRSLTGGQPLKVLEQNYQYDLLVY